MSKGQRIFTNQKMYIALMCRYAKGKLRKKMVNADTIYNYLSGNGILRIDYIKVDIEGEEGNMLWGASHVLNELQPKLSLCISLSRKSEIVREYHNRS